MKKLIEIAGALLLIILIYSCEKDTDNSIKDNDGNIYTSVIIGEQEWLVQNLRTTTYNNGDTIKTTTPVSLDVANDTTSKYQWAYDGYKSNVITYGRLYTWYTVNDKRNICPAGWHVPSDAEWTALTTYLGGGDPDQYGQVPYIGGALKEKGTAHWWNPNTGASDRAGFKALPGGIRGYEGAFELKGAWGAWWSSTQLSTDLAWFRLLTYDWSCIVRNVETKQYGHAVRCIKD